MGQIIYDVAVTLDGFIARPDGSYGGFLMDGEHAEDYLQRLQGYSTVIMGRKTYEAGYAFGLQPGERAYPHMEHYIVSSTLAFAGGDVHVVSDGAEETLRRLRSSTEGDIYFCGGGELAAWMIERGLIDQLVIKLNPVCFGTGIRLLGPYEEMVPMALLDSRSYANGVICSRYAVVKGSEG